MPAKRLYLALKAIFARSTIFLATALVFVALSAPKAEARDIVLLIHMTEHWAMTKSHYIQRNDELNKLFPNHEIWSIQPEALRFMWNREKIRAYIVKQMARMTFRPEDRVTHLVIDSHGGTHHDQVKQNEFTILSQLGQFDEDGVDAELAAILSPLQNHMASDATIVLNSCSTMCDGAVKSGKRARALMKFLGVKDGQLYGATTVEGPMLYEPSYPYVKTGIFLTLGLFALQFSQNHDVSEAMSNSVFLGMSVPMFILYGRRLQAYINRHLGMSNKGRIYRFKNGEVVSATKIDKFKNLRAIYAIPGCEPILENSPQ